MNVLLIGSGGREHALANQIAKSPLLGQLFAAPGNPGIGAVAQCVALDPADAQAVIDFCRVMDVGFVVIGPEVPLVAGLVDALAEAGIKAFGPSRAAAQLEGSKGFTKDLCTAYAIPTAAAAQFGDADTAKDYIRTQGAPIVVKADGLAAGKGVVVAQTVAEAEAAVDQMLGGLFGAAGQSLVIEEFLEGEEVSFFALCDGRTARAFASAQDHKRVGEGDTGPNTGGMGAFSPAPVMDAALSERVMAEIVRPALHGMAAMGMPFKGVLFAGLILTRDGPKLIEFNVRFGDPETQAILPRLEGDLLALMLACAEGRLAKQDFAFSAQHALTIVLAAEGYPGTPKRGTEIRGLDKAAALPGVIVTHAGTKRDGARLLADGGRVLNVTGLGATLAEAQARAYAAVDAIDWPGGFCRRDIGWRALKGK
ncbi:phosphoribosylamine--glycine ligase [Methylovirgula ligni]|uniref:Phosphoribosylamine--glycine ligase n=1 Tax=Methylovirgula ligni TaxID=569860 RepID=A0A3D9YUV1_9HYPH|nr:phosphoribosylamine--glycine ligase [Methylovirgula ligni]QAY95949.1 phosphoribosylamine--glycine ligase [Methylovirgula ligni]REF86386.1 phosphoribosylamine--glycine ligase [Methylovirgula ligni]